MDIWILVIVLLIISIILFILSIYAKEDTSQYDEHFRELTNNQSQELQSIKTRLSELEGQYTDRYPQETIETFPTYEETATVTTGEPVAQFEDVTDITRDHIIELYTQGYTMQEIAFEANVNVSVVQYVVDDYIENR